MTLADGGLHQAIESDYRRGDGEHQAEMRKWRAGSRQNKRQAGEKTRNPDAKPDAMRSHAAIIAWALDPGGADSNSLLSYWLYCVIFETG